MGSFDIGILILLTYFCTYGIVNRICQCVEHLIECKYCIDECEDK